ncbi:MAG TPA: hypothetical protein VNA04_04265 [Thermoanaerobaculia bacterium]|nr:hypothetical protein [Thermoanaerobaculia bacterium]
MDVRGPASTRIAFVRTVSIQPEELGYYFRLHGLTSDPASQTSHRWEAAA